MYLCERLYFCRNVTSLASYLHDFRHHLKMDPNDFANIPGALVSINYFKNLSAD